MQNKDGTNRVVILFLVAITLLISSCYNYEVQEDGAYSDSDLTEPSLAKELVFIEGGDVFLATKFLKEVEEVISSGSIELVAINNNHTKVLYKETGANIQIYDIATESTIGEVEGSANAIWCDYHANNETIYFLDTDSNLDTHGPDVLTNHPINLIEDFGFTTSSTGVFSRSVVVLADGSFVYSFQVSALFLDYYLVRSTGDGVPEKKTTGRMYDQFRLNHEETVIVATSTIDRANNLSLNNFGSTDEIDFDESFGVPVNFQFGYYVNTESNRILYNTGTSAAIYYGIEEITAIDF